MAAADEESTIFCTNCGVSNQASSNFCFKCGTKISQADEEKKQEEIVDIIDISEYLGKEKLIINDTAELIECGACIGGGWFDSHGPCTESSSYKKCKCPCCDGSGKMPNDYKQCWRCKGKGNYDQHNLCYPASQYKKIECPLCGACYFSSKKYDKLRNNGTRNTKCETCQGK